MYETFYVRLSHKASPDVQDERTTRRDKEILKQFQDDRCHTDWFDKLTLGISYGNTPFVLRTHRGFACERNFKPSWFKKALKQSCILNAGIAGKRSLICTHFRNFPKGKSYRSYIGYRFRLSYESLQAEALNPKRFLNACRRHLLGIF